MRQFEGSIQELKGNEPQRARFNPECQQKSAKGEAAAVARLLTLKLSAPDFLLQGRAAFLSLPFAVKRKATGVKSETIF